MFEKLNRLAKNQKLIVECSNGEEFPVEKIYHVSGQASAVKILIGGEGITNKLLVKIDELKEELENYQEELKSAERALDSTEEDLRDAKEKHEEYLQKIDSALESAEFKLGIKTSSRHSFDRIDEIAEILDEKIRELENEKDLLGEEISGLKVDNRALAWQIEQLSNDSKDYDSN
ncbi:MAG: hypothetical protein FMNOHCHN_01613 [Ignavibacteriaceae bacterium]|nr:hypothetical protein [Ignavibacteriaceae bacterium]